MPTRLEKYWSESGLGVGQGDMEKKDYQLYRRSYIVCKTMDKVEEEEAMGRRNARCNQASMC